MADQSVILIIQQVGTKKSPRTDLRVSAAEKSLFSYSLITWKRNSSTGHMTQYVTSTVAIYLDTDRSHESRATFRDVQLFPIRPSTRRLSFTQDYSVDGRSFLEYLEADRRGGESLACAA